MAATSPAFGTRPRLVVVMGVTGCGKSTVARQLARRLGGIYLDGDDFHPEGNVEKMRRGIALGDEERWPWLEEFSKAMARRDGLVVGACSALKAAYRARIRECAAEPVLFVFLDGCRELIAQRLSARDDHFMPASLLDSQFATLEPPAAEEPAFRLDISGSPRQVVDLITRRLAAYVQKQ